ncbi:hypothetical protein ACLOJK_010024 [Asimina triloba]
MLEFRLLHDRSGSSQSITDVSESSRNDEACSSICLEQDTIRASDVSFHNCLKLAVLSGLLAFQGTEQAVAGSDFVGGTQSIPYLGDLGDISTGFASVEDLHIHISGAEKFELLNVCGLFFHNIDEEDYPDICKTNLSFNRFGEADLPIDDIAAAYLLVYFGVSTLLDATSSDGLKAEEEQKEAELAVSEFSGNGAGLLAAANTAISTFALVFVAEWGDKSFFSTIGEPEVEKVQLFGKFMMLSPRILVNDTSSLAAASSPLGVIGGALAGHAAATLLAVLGGSFLGTFFSEKVIAYVGGSLFLVFAAVTLIEIVN